MSAGSQINMYPVICIVLRIMKEEVFFYTVCLNTYFKKHSHDSGV